MPLISRRYSYKKKTAFIIAPPSLQDPWIKLTKVLWDCAQKPGTLLKNNKDLNHRSFSKTGRVYIKLLIFQSVDTSIVLWNLLESRNCDSQDSGMLHSNKGKQTGATT